MARLCKTDDACCRPPTAADALHGGRAVVRARVVGGDGGGDRSAAATDRPQSVTGEWMGQREMVGACVTYGHGSSTGREVTAVEWEVAAGRRDPAGGLQGEAQEDRGGPRGLAAV